MKAKKEYPDLTANPQNIEVGDWVRKRDNFGQVTQRVSSGICEFWVHWSGDTVPINELASRLFKVDYIGEDLAGQRFDGGHCYRLLFQDNEIKAEVKIDDGGVEIWSLERLVSSLKSAANKAQPEAVQVEVVTEELTEEEERDRLFLERKVERAFYEAGKALLQLRDRRLYRSTHNSFEDYVQDRFGMKRAHSYRLIEAALVVENLSPKCLQFGDILPTNEAQCRPLTKLEPEQQREAWTKAVESAGGKVPSGRIVKDIVQRIRERTRVPNPYRVGEVCQLIAKDDPELKGKGGQWCIVSEVHEFSCTVNTWFGEITVRLENLKSLDFSEKECQEMKVLCVRLTKIRDVATDPMVHHTLQFLGHLLHPELTPVQQQLLESLEKIHNLC